MKTITNWRMAARYGLSCLILLLHLTLPLSAFSWDGFDYDTGDYIEIDDSDSHSIKPGAIVQIYDYEDGNHHTVEITSLNGAYVEVYDEDADEYRTFEMEPVILIRS
jgi:hypothetical protein